MITVAADIMGGDNPPELLAEGVFRAVKELDIKAVVVCTEEIKNKLGALPKNVSFAISDTFVEMTDEPGVVLKEKKNSSMCLACELTKKGEADCVVSCGNTGALFTCASIILRRIKGVRRAALCSVIPLESPMVLLDCGANLDATPEILRLYARMGSAYAEKVVGIQNPRVAILNNGTEAHKGTPLYAETNKLLSSDNTVNFVGNAEGKSIPFGVCDVLVCDGFTGNIFLKTVEGMAKFMSKNFKKCLTANAFTKLGALPSKSKIDALKKSLDPSEYGGAPFLGLAHPVVKAHGNSDAHAFCSAIKQLVRYKSERVIETISEAMSSTEETQ